MPPHPKNHALEAAIDHFGSQKKLADALKGWSQQTISRVLNGRNRISAEMALDIDRATNGVIPRWTLRPDIFSVPRAGTHTSGPALIDQVSA